MFIVECLPLVKGLNKESLSYFSKDFFEPGSLVRVNIRSKPILALVLESKSVLEAKSEIKSADFQMKKISGLTARPFLQKEFLEAAKRTAAFFATSTGGVLSHLLPNYILENPGLLSNGKTKNSKKIESKTKNEVSILQADFQERLSHYKSLVREEFAKKRSLFIVVPHNEDVEYLKETLSRGIEHFVVSLSSLMKPKEVQAAWKQAAKEEHPILIIATPLWLCIPRNDLGTIVLHNENESGWKTLSRPFIDTRVFAEYLCEELKCRCIMSDSVLRIGTLYRYKQNEIGEFESVKWRLPSSAEVRIIDSKEAAKKEKEFKVVSRELHELLEASSTSGGRLFLYASRKGLAPTTVCRDCGASVTCSNCDAPMVLYRTSGRAGTVFRCHQCGEVRDAAETCKNCKSWRLASFGAGIDRVASEIRDKFPTVPIFEIHSDVVKSHAKALKIVSDFYNTRGSILLGTEMALSYLHKKVEFAGIAALDSLFSIPNFRISEKIFRTIIKMGELAKENFLIQTRRPKDPILLLASVGNILDFYREDLKDREALAYPPFGIFVKVTIRGTKNFVTKELETMKKVLEPWQPTIFPSLHEKRSEQAAMNAVIKMDRKLWPHQNLIETLKSLPPHFEIKVAPDSVL